MRDGLLQLDTTAFLWLSRLQDRARILRLARWISRSGDGPLYAALAAIVYVVADDQGTPFVQTGLLAFAIEIPGFMALKALIRRDRPFVQIPNCPFVIKPHDQFSMPSGHTTAAFLMASLTAVCFPVVTVAVYVWASLVGVSRVVLGVHYPGDILAGAVLGQACTWLALSLLA